jgi:hypothetical protein
MYSQLLGYRLLGNSFEISPGSFSFTNLDLVIFQDETFQNWIKENLPQIRQYILFNTLLYIQYIFFKKRKYHAKKKATISVAFKLLHISLSTP